MYGSIVRRMKFFMLSEEELPGATSEDEVNII